MSTIPRLTNDHGRSEMFLEDIMKSREWDDEDKYDIIEAVIDNELTNGELAVLSTHLHHNTNTGRFSKIYQSDIEKAIIDGDHDYVPRSVSGKTVTDLFYELDSPDLDDDEIDAIENMAITEYESMLKTIQDISSQQTSDDPEETLYDVYTTNYNIICARKSTLFDYSDVPKNVNVSEISKSKKVITYCFDVDTLLESLSKSDINPITGKPFDEKTLDILLRKYSKEIKMLRHADEVLSQDKLEV